MRHRRFLSTLGVLLIVAAPLMAASQNGGGVPKTLLTKFKRGVNITRWFCYLANQNDGQHFANYLVRDDIAEFKKLHVSWIRLCVSPEAIYEEGQPKANNLPLLDAAIKKLEAAGLAVVLDLHDNGQMKLDTPGHDNSGFLTFWKSMARHYAGKQETSTVFELLNEPQFLKNPEVWNSLQAETTAAIREIDPKRTIMVSGNGWSGIENLNSLKPLPQSNLLYTFHCYDPFYFTHQGASWVGDPPQGLKSMPFPSSPDNITDALKNSSPSDADAIKSFGNSRFDAAYLKARIAKGMEFESKYHVPVILGEFGAYPPVSPVESRGRWFAAMNAAITSLNVPNALWGYDDALGLGRQLLSNNTLKLDPVTLRSLYGASH
jgi:aryl-phospho-beta-D-glucosidase BglC (GH1 family)